MYVIIKSPTFNNTVFLFESIFNVRYYLNFSKDLFVQFIQFYGLLYSSFNFILLIYKLHITATEIIIKFVISIYAAFTYTIRFSYL